MEEARTMATAERDAVMRTMACTFDEQDEPKVGIFWFDPDAGELFGVQKALAAELAFNSFGKKTIRQLHRTLWQKERNKGNPRYQGDYTSVPRGRVFEDVGAGFQVMVGSWFNEHPQVKALVIDEFDLGKAKHEFVIDEHWELGRGWDE